MVNQGPFGVGQEGAPDLASQAETLHFKIPPRIIQEGNHPQEAHKCHKTPPL